jgi:hypothetical protein
VPAGHVRNDPARNTDTPRSARKRPAGEGAAEEEEDEEEGDEEDGKGRAAGGRRGAADRQQSDYDTEEEEDDEDEEAAAMGAMGRRQTGGLKRRRRSLAGQQQGHAPGERAWQSQDVLKFTRFDHPFHGITRERGLHPPNSLSSSLSRSPGSQPAAGSQLLKQAHCSLQPCSHFLSPHQSC